MKLVLYIISIYIYWHMYILELLISRIYLFSGWDPIAPSIKRIILLIPYTAIISYWSEIGIVLMFVDVGKQVRGIQLDSSTVFIWFQIFWYLMDFHIDIWYRCSRDWLFDVWHHWTKFGILKWFIKWFLKIYYMFGIWSILNK